MTTDTETDLSVVIVARNEEDQIRDCIESVLTLCDPVEVSEMIVVDSNSSDRTVDVAREFPVTVLRIPDDDLCTPSAGRYVGSQFANGEFVLFVDGDLHVTDGWLARAIRTLRKNENVAGVDGQLNDLPDSEAQSIEYVRGIMLFDAAALESVGGFDPWLSALEDIEVSYRLTRNGYELIRLPVVVGTESKSFGVSEVVRRWRSNYMLASGEVIRKSLDDLEMLRKWLAMFRTRFAIGVWVLAGVLLFATFAGLFLPWLVISTVGFVAVSARRGLWLTVHTALKTVLTPIAIAIGFRRFDPRGQFPMERVTVVECAEGDSD
jgi:glycosyltransferase involved in cell wall biosynthesis